MSARASQKFTKAPPGSCTTVMRPDSMTSNGGATTVAPRAAARSAVSSADATVT
jgi:hypothetical protein